MDDGNYSEQPSRGFSAGQMVVLFLAGVAVCAVFFTIGFLVGYNEKSSNAAPVTEKLADSSDIPPVVGQDSPKASAESRRAGKTASSESRAEPLRPEPRTSPADQDASAQAKSESEPQMPTAVMPSKKSGTAPSVMKSPEPSATPSTSGVMIQVAATGTRPDAEKLVKALKTLSYPAVLLTPEQAHATDNLFRVQVGPYASRDVAEKIRDRLIQDGFKQPFIKH